MSDSFDKNQNELEQYEIVETVDSEVLTTEISDEEESTVFSAPPEHKKEKTKKTFTIFGLAVSGSIMTIVSACLAVAILVGATIAVIKLIPETKDEETSSSVFEDIPVVDADSTAFTEVTVKNKNGEFKFVVNDSLSTNQTSKNWTVEGVDYEKLSVSSVTAIISAVSNINAIREVDKAPTECGFDNPTVSFSVKSTKDEPYTILIGSKSTDGYGHYMKLEGKETVYITKEAEFSDLEFSLLDISDTTPIPTTVFSSDTSANKEQDGSYAYFDSLTLSGKLYPETVTIINNPGKTESAGLTPYLVTTPMKRHANAESLSSPVALFSSSTTVVGNYAMDVNEQTLKEFGLDDPDAIVTMTINGEAKTFKFALVDDTYCAIVYDGATMIRKANISSFAFLSFDVEDYYYRSIFMNTMTDVKRLKIKTNDEEITFDISFKDDGNGNKTFYVKANGKDIPTKNFQDYYKDFVNIECSDFNVGDVGNKADCTVTFTFYEGEDQVIKLYKSGATQYQYSLNGVNMGKITSSAYDKMLKNMKIIADGGTVY